MALHYLIDGYNLLYALPDIPPGPWPAKRDIFIALLAVSKPHGNNRLTVVFDSREGGGSSQKGAIEIIFTAGESADDWLIRHVRQMPNPRVVIIVTDDKGIHRMVRGTGAKVMGTREFLSRGPTPERRAETKPSVDRDAITDELKKKWL